MLVKDYTSVAGFVTLFTILIVFTITFSSTRHGFIWMVTLTHISIKCDHPWTLACTGKWAFIIGLVLDTSNNSILSSNLSTHRECQTIVDVSRMLKFPKTQKVKKRVKCYHFENEFSTLDTSSNEFLIWTVKVYRMLSASLGKIELLLGWYCMSILEPSKPPETPGNCVSMV